MASASGTIDQATLDLVRSNFIAKRDIIISHSKPWTPCTISHLLEINDKNSDVPAEIIMYKALKASSPNRIGIADVIVKVKA